jgi:hypothetical protein
VSSNPASSVEVFHGGKATEEDRGEREGWDHAVAFCVSVTWARTRTQADTMDVRVRPARPKRLLNLVQLWVVPDATSARF